jgi:hypothetical protein
MFSYCGVTEGKIMQAVGLAGINPPCRTWEQAMCKSLYYYDTAEEREKS